MGNFGDDFGQMLGTSGAKGPNIRPNMGNEALGVMSQGQNVYNQDEVQKALQNYGLGQGTSGGVYDSYAGLNPAEKSQLMDTLSTGSTTGSRFATEQVQNNPILGQLFGQGGQLQKGIGLEDAQTQRLNDLQNQGFQLQPEDMTQYGQTSGNISRLFGQQGNQAASDLASRGLSSSGAAGATFSGLAGNQNEQLAQAQQQIMQQRFQNTQNQIANQQNFISSLQGNVANLGGQAGQDINSQYGRQLSGAQQRSGALSSNAGLQMGANQSNLGLMTGADAYNAANQPMDVVSAGTRGMTTASGLLGSGAPMMAFLGGGKAGALMGGASGGAGGAAAGGSATGGAPVQQYPQQ